MAKKYNHSDPKHVKERVLQVSVDNRQRVRWLGIMLDSYEARAYIWQYLEQARLDSSPHQGEETHNTSYTIGLQDMARELQNDILTNYPAAYNLMRSEAVKREHERNEDDAE